jgi:hypothetical protein
MEESEGSILVMGFISRVDTFTGYPGYLFE